jgi:pimeloyl-ACP methyl ester carboxylesterase
VTAAGRPVVLAVHSGGGVAGYAASDRIPDQIAAMVYVDSGPGTGASEPDFDGAEKPMLWDELKEEENLDGLSEEQLETFRRRAVPEPGGVLHDAPQLTNDARLDVPSTAMHGIHVRRVQGRGRGGLRVARGLQGATGHHLGRPADEPLADVVTPERPGRRDRRCRAESLIDLTGAHCRCPFVVFVVRR